MWYEPVSRAHPTRDIVIRLPRSDLANATRLHPELSCGGDVTVRDSLVLAKDVFHVVEDDQERIMDLFDAAIVEAVESGSAGVFLAEDSE